MTTATLLAAALLVFATGAAHSWFGERRLLGPLLAPEPNRQLSDFARRTIRFAWHLTTIAWCGIGVALISLAVSTPLDQLNRPVLGIIAATFLLTACVTLISSRGRHLAWVVFLVIAGLSAAPLV